MRRGTTPTCIYKTKTDIRGFDNVYLTFWQGGKTIFEKSNKDIKITEETIDEEVIYKAEIKLDQTETLALSTIGKVEMQMRGAYPDGTVIASNIIEVPVCKILKEGII